MNSEWPTITKMEIFRQHGKTNVYKILWKISSILANKSAAMCNPEVPNPVPGERSAPFPIEHT